VLAGRNVRRLVKAGVGALLLYQFLRVSAGPLLRNLTRWRVDGVKNVPPQGRLIVSSNHLHFLDVVALGIAIPRHITFMGKAEVFSEPVLGWLVRALRSIPVRRGEVDRRALRRAEALLEADRVLGMLPEGTRGRGAELQQARDGVALVALRTGAPILPVGLIGPDKVFPALRRLRRADLWVNIGEPIAVERAEGRIPRARVEELTSQIMHSISELLPPEHRGVYG
jgi:1-acyl-sn-glycerol-3-phosphate acyltransferase